MGEDPACGNKPGRLLSEIHWTFEDGPQKGRKIKASFRDIEPCIVVTIQDYHGLVQPLYVLEIESEFYRTAGRKAYADGQIEENLRHIPQDEDCLDLLLFIKARRNDENWISLDADEF